MLINFKLFWLNLRFVLVVLIFNQINSIVSISNVQYGDLNFDNSLNISDLIILIEHIIGFNVLTNNHKILISDSNEDGLINITDLILNLELILE